MLTPSEQRRLHLARHGANSGAKALTVIGSMLTGGDSIDDVAVLRAGAAGSLFDGTRAPSTVGSWLRAHKWSNVRQLDAISRQLLARLWAAGAGPADLAAPLTIDLDWTIVEVHGRAKQGAAFGYTKVRGYRPQLATCAQTGQVLMSRLRGGSAGAARGARSFLTETVSRVRNAGATGQLLHLTALPVPDWLFVLERGRLRLRASCGLVGGDVEFDAPPAKASAVQSGPTSRSR